MLLNGWLNSLAKSRKPVSRRKRKARIALPGAAEKLEERTLLSGVSAEVSRMDADASDSLSTPSILSPGSSTSDTTPTISWTRSSGASKYWLYVADVNTGKAVVNSYVYSTSFTTQSLTSGHTYRAWVKAIDSAGNGGNWSAYRDFKVTAAQMTTPTLTGPSSTTSDTTPTITWTSSNGAAKYWLFVADTNTGKAVVNKYVSGTSSTTQTLTAGHTYRAWVKAINSAGQGTNWSAHRDFKVTGSQQLTVPKLTGPSSTTSDTTPTITWTGSAGAAKYWLFVADTNTGKAVVNKYVTSTSFTTQALTAGHTYRAWVKAINSAGQGTNWSAYRDFKVTGSQQLTVPRLTGPSSTTSDTTPTITWTGSAGAAKYWLFVADVNTGKAVVNKYVNATSFTTQALTAGHTYRAWVKAINSAGQGTNWSSPRDFKISGSQQLTVPQLTGPSSTTSDNTPTITWTGSAGAAKYWLFVADVNTGKAVVNKYVTGTSFTTQALTAGHTYRAWVKAINSAGQGTNWSSPRDFKVTQSSGSTNADNILYVNFDGVQLTHQDLMRYGSDWRLDAKRLDPEKDGVRVDKYLAGNSSRETIIAHILNMVQEDFRPFGVTVRRTYGKAIEGVGATTIFVGKDNLGGSFGGRAGDVDQRNNNLTDIGFARPQNWSRTDDTVRRMAQLIAHEAGHTYGLIHTYVYQNGQMYNDVMGINYTNNKRGVKLSTYPDVKFIDRTFVEINNHGFDPNRTNETQNPYRHLLTAFNGSVHDRRGGESGSGAGLEHDHREHEVHEHDELSAGLTHEAIFAMEQTDNSEGESREDGADVQQVVVARRSRSVAAKSDQADRNEDDGVQVDGDRAEAIAQVFSAFGENGLSDSLLS